MDIKYTPIDVYDKEGNLVRIEAYDGKGDFIMQALWDPNDEQNHDNRVKFREWFYQHLERSYK